MFIRTQTRSLLSLGLLAFLGANRSTPADVRDHTLVRLTYVSDLEAHLCFH